MRKPSGEPDTATVHDLVGVAVLVLPPDVRAALGNQYTLDCALELETQDLVVIAREDGVVAYIRLPIVVKEMDYAASELKSGMVLHDITGKHARHKAQEQSKQPEKGKEPTQEKSKLQKPRAPSGKAGRHA